MSSLWSPAGATSGNQSQMVRPEKRLKQAKSVAYSCHRLPETFHGKQGVCRGLPPVAGGPLPAKEGVDLNSLRPGLSLAAAIRARALVATTAGAGHADHGSILVGPRSTRGRSCVRLTWASASIQGLAGGHFRVRLVSM